MSISSGVNATELVYAPVNPTFGGNPNNAPGLLNVATAQNGFKAPTKSPIETFNANLQSSILSKLASSATSTIFGGSAPLTPGSYDTLNYIIKITDSGGGDVTITTTDKESGATASFTVNAGTLVQ